MKSYSQFGEDKWIIEHAIFSNSRPRGAVVDVGAGDPIINSNSYLFELAGWHTICIEGDPRRIEKLQSVRKHVIQAVIDDGEGKAYFEIDKLGLSRIVNTPSSTTIIVQTVRLETVLQEHKIGAIDLLSIDVEGHELDVLGSFDMKLHEPKVIIVEYRTRGTINESPLIYALQLFNYKLAAKMHANLIFVRNDSK